MEFLIKKGVFIDTTTDTLKSPLVNIERLKINDYKIKLGSLLEPEKRKYYTVNNFTIL